MSIQYIDLYEITKLQHSVMKVIQEWATIEKKPIPRTIVMERMVKLGVNEFSVKDALGSLIKRGYIRPAIITSNKTYYVQLRRI